MPGSPQMDHNEECVFPEKRPRTRKRKEREQEMENRLSQMEALLRAATGSTLSDTQPLGISDDGAAASSREQWTQSTSRPPSSAAADVIDKRRATDKSVQPTNNDEVTCASYLSLCTFPAIEWVSQQSGMSDFLVSARRLSKAITGEERLDKVIDSARAPEPDLETALQWTKGNLIVYFENCLDSIFELIDRRDFETRLRRHFAGAADSTLSKGWYAMRNTVYASGCRFIISEARNPQAFSESRAQSWKYLENALSVHTELLYGPTDLDCIRALVLMAFHAEALGTPALEYTLLSNATRLAQSKGLHLRTTPGTQMASEDDLARQRIWWTLYSYEKHLAYRSGVPSAIDDDYISCPVPTSMKRGSSISSEFFTKTVAQAQISSSISKLLNSAKAMSAAPETILARVQDLDKRLEVWRESLHPVYQTRAPFKPSVLSPEMQIYHVLFLHFCYHVLVIAIHGVFCYPWTSVDPFALWPYSYPRGTNRSNSKMQTNFRRLVRFQDPRGRTLYGEAPPSGELIGQEVPVYAGDDPWNLKAGGTTAKVAKVLRPLPRVPMIYGIGLNYKTHISEAGFPSPKHPTVFTKPPDALSGPFDDVAIHPECTNMDYEGELAVIIGRDCKNVASSSDAFDHVLGYAAANDVSSRYWQIPEIGGQQHGYAKSFDGFAPLGPVIVSPEAVGDVNQLTLVTRVNGEERQRAQLDDLLFGVGDLIVHLSRGTTLRAGTVILTGTPGGVAAFMKPPAWLKDGDTVEVSISEIGTIANRYVSDRLQ
ncbi:hypothetical protein CEP54_007604 [Fusarium duplospermum]|uniref:Xylanolytic transcriptional activator regulatory domain-containing protein n=1 Tax=Fusarium duplospermum TaxID=1325734 RepID=A0A428Q074_9HYPO|nr:hypothetical protein CEP54_007604 [Fusarium duplospermum]